MTTVNNKRVFKVMVDGKELEMAVVRPNHKVNQHAQLIYNRAFREAVVPEDGSKGALVEAKIDDVMREQKLWDDYKQKKFEETQKRLFDNEKKLAKERAGKVSYKMMARRQAETMEQVFTKIKQTLSDVAKKCK
jgi:hypothetical protein